MTDLTYPATLTPEGKLQILPRREFDRDMIVLVKSEIRDVEIIVRERKPKRGNQANRYYWSCVVTPFRDWLEQQWGTVVSKERAHDILKSVCSVEEIMLPNGKIQKTVIDTSGMKRDEFAAYTTRCRNYLRDMFGIETEEARKDEEYL
jgi:hypothetical protein